MHRGRPAVEILPLLSRAADRALLGLTSADLWEQAQAMDDGEPYVLGVTVPPDPPFTGLVRCSRLRSSWPRLNS